MSLTRARRGTGPRLEAGMAITIEPMIKAQFEHTLLVTAQGCEAQRQRLEIA